MASFHGAAGADSFPASLLTDNGAVFPAASRGRRCALELQCARQGIRLIHSRPYHPQTCEKVERFHQTLKKFLLRQGPIATVAELQALLDTFRLRRDKVDITGVVTLRHDSRLHSGSAEG